MRVVVADRAIMNGYSLGLAAGLRANGIEVMVAGPARADVRDATALYPRNGVPGQRVAKGIDAVIGVAASHKLFALSRPDLVHIQWQTPMDELHAITAKRVYGIPVAYTAQNPGDRIGSPLPHVATQRRLIELADLVFATGPSMLERLEAAYPCVTAKGHILPIGNYEHMITRYDRRHAREQLGVCSGDPVFAWVGQIAPRKGVELLLSAFSRLQSESPRVHLLIAGYSPDPGYLRHLKQLAPSEGSVDWRVADRPVPHDVLDLVVSAATQVVLPFPDATHSASLVLAMTHGRCVVSTDVGEISAVLRGRGLVVSPGDGDGLLDAMRVAQESAAQCDQLGKAARHYVLTDLAWPVIGANVLELYRRVVGR